MDVFIIIRGPAASGKTTVARALAKQLNASYFSFDDVMRENGLDKIEGDGISAQNFVRANEIVLPLLRKVEGVVILDGCFYRKEQMDHLLSRLPLQGIIIDLKVSLKDCLSRNKARLSPMTDENIRAVFRLVQRHSFGVEIPSSGRTVDDVVHDILTRIPSGRS